MTIDCKSIVITGSVVDVVPWMTIERLLQAHLLSTKQKCKNNNTRKTKKQYTNLIEPMCNESNTATQHKQTIQTTKLKNNIQD
jgi:hypothetical protein